MSTNRILQRLVTGAGLVLLSCLAVAQGAEIYCTETVTKVIAAYDGNIYFTTSSTCQSWCEINWGSTDANNHAYAMLLAAQAEGASLTFGWGAISTCSSQNAAYASPYHVIL